MADDEFSQIVGPEFPETGTAAEIAAIMNTDDLRRDCAFCHWERSAKDDNHAPECPYWIYFGWRSDHDDQW